MPTVPTMGETPQVAPLQVSGIRSSVSPQDFGAGMARTVQGVAGTVASDYFQELKEARDQADTLRLMDKRNKLAEKLSPKLVEWNQRKGEDTLKSPEEASSFIQSAADELASDLPDHLRSQFLAHAQTERVNVGRSLMVHSSAAMEQMKNATYKARMETIGNQMANSPSDNDLSDVWIAAGMGETIDWLKMNGIKPESEIAKASVASVKSGLGRKRIEALFKSNADLTAQEVGEKYLNDGTLVGDDKTQVSAMLNTSKYITKVDKLMAEIDQETSGQPNAYQMAMEIITSETSGDEKYRAKARDEFQIRWRAKKEAEREHNDYATKTIYDIVHSDNGNVTNEGKIKAFELGGGEMVDKYLGYCKGYNASRQTDGLAFLQLKQLVDSGDVSKMTADGFYRQFYNRFSPGDWNEAIKYFDYATSPAKMTEAERKAMQDEMGGFVSEKEYVYNILKEWGYSYKDIEKLSPSDKATSGAYAVFDALNTAISNRKMELSRERKIEIRELSPQEIKHAISPVLMYLVSRYDKSTIPAMKPVPEEERQRIKGEYRAKHKYAPELTDQEADAVYRKAVILGRIK